MLYERIKLIEGNDDAYIDAYVPDRTARYTRKALLVIPGGGYGVVCGDREGEPIAHAFLPLGYACFVLNYSVAGKRVFPSQLIEASAAIAHIKNNADKYGIDPDKVFAVGFSAGGHLAASLGTLWHLDKVNDALDIPYGYNKPAGVMLIYPVISGDTEITDVDSIINLLGKNDPTDDERAEVSLEKQVDDRSAPAFIYHTSNDPVVNVKNSLRMAEAYKNAGLNFELHIMPDAPHGVALGNEITAFKNPKLSAPGLDMWINAAAVWANGLN